MSVRRQKLQKWLLAFLAFAAALAVLLPLLLPEAYAAPSGGGLLVRIVDGAPSIFTLFALSFVLGVPTVLWHELGHAFAARRLLDTDVSVRVGKTGTLGTLRLGRITADVSAWGHPGRVAGRRASTRRARPPAMSY